MSDYSLSSRNDVKPLPGALCRRFDCGGTVLAGQSVYVAADGDVEAADAVTFAHTNAIGIAVAALVLMVIFSYVQTILHYPDGGGAYTVSKDNLGRIPSLLAGAALLTDYVLTVSVSASAGVRAVTSATSRRGTSRRS